MIIDRSRSQRTSRMFLCNAMILIAIFTFSPRIFAYTANKVWFEFHDHGIYRVYANYTVADLKEFREAYIEFTDKKVAESYYFDLLRGADFYLPDPKTRKFITQPIQPEPW